MQVLQKALQDRDIPRSMILRQESYAQGAQQTEAARQKVITLLCQEEYGMLPPEPDALTVEVIEKNTKYCASKAVYEKIIITSEVCGGRFSFPLTIVYPAGRRSPCILHISFRDAVPDRYMPTEEICDNGFAVASFCYQEITKDNADFTDGLAGVVFRDGRRNPSDAGKLALWAWAAMRAMDFLMTRDELDHSRIAVAGHSRLGKTALLAGALDTRFQAVYANESGCSGAALSRDKQGETVAKILEQFPYWFCENYAKYGGDERSLPFDQHDLLSLIAPRLLYVASAAEDAWADPTSEYLSCVAASQVYEALQLKGLTPIERFPEPGECFHDGCVGYHLRSGTHYFTRYDWQQFMRFLKNHWK